jgi:VanZ family protein
MAIITGLSSIPGDPKHIPAAVDFLLWIPPDIQNLLHIPLYAGLTWIWCRNLQKMALSVQQSIIIAVVLCLSFGIIDEFHQTFVVGRQGSVSDIFLNIVGIIIGLAIYKIQIRNSSLPEDSGA